ncbi:hypothetical protein AVEN_33202-1 [Araneus ventricosus]|uniref:Uncharacterized protein n=1 Tax=Araneus ventricosus TaxID=182803 RepID=A0A4Y2UKQ0_ARAVE|nr:hypothetical protein AVEN_33202-1 [Araneus ventricosus]
MIEVRKSVTDRRLSISAMKDVSDLLSWTYYLLVCISHLVAFRRGGEKKQKISTFMSSFKAKYDKREKKFYYIAAISPRNVVQHSEHERRRKNIVQHFCANRAGRRLDMLRY